LNNTNHNTNGAAFPFSLRCRKAKAMSIMYGALANRVDAALANDIAFYQAAMEAG